MKYLLQADWEDLVKRAERYEALLSCIVSGSPLIDNIRRASISRTAIDVAMDAEIGRQADESRRANGGSDCKVCGREYRKHRKGGPIGCGDEQFLNRLCDGSLVKL